MKRIMVLGVLFFVIISSFLPFYLKQNNDKKVLTTQVSIQITRFLERKMIVKEIIENKKETMVKMDETSEEKELPNLYEDFTTEEIYMIQRCVETETYGADLASKTNVASVIFNRLEINDYGGVIQTITALNQFTYWRTNITDTTIEAVENAYKYGDTTNGCIAFRSGYIPEKWYTYRDKYWELQFVDDAGHGFYR